MSPTSSIICGSINVISSYASQGIIDKEITRNEKNEHITMLLFLITMNMTMSMTIWKIILDAYHSFRCSLAKNDNNAREYE